MNTNTKLIEAIEALILRNETRWEKDIADTAAERETYVRNMGKHEGASAALAQVMALIDLDARGQL